MLLALLLAAGTCRAGTVPERHVEALLAGSALTTEQLARLEARLLETPTDLDARSRLLGYYFLNGRKSTSARETRQRHVLWVIRNRPDSDIAGLPYANLDPVTDGQVYSTARDEWLAIAKRRSSDTVVLGNAAKFLHLHDSESARTLLLQAQQLEPECPDWPRELGQLEALSVPYDPASRKTRAAAALAHYERALALTEPWLRSSLTADVAKMAFEAGELDKAERLAKQLLDAPLPEQWNHGNAVHFGNLILGRLALRRGDLESARSRLLAAGRTPGSSQLDSFGPNMTLALELLEKGEKAVVLQYLELCASFWKMGAAQLKTWTATIQEGGIPNFGANLNY